MENILVGVGYREKIRRRDGTDIKRNPEEFLYGDGTVLPLYFSGDYTNLYMQRNCIELNIHMN